MFFETRQFQIDEFQFQSGAIKRNSTGRTREQIHKFQFQSGAIKSASRNMKHEKKNMFQFQSGAIKRFVRLQDRPLLRSFNSKVVRLKVN